MLVILIIGKEKSHFFLISEETRLHFHYILFYQNLLFEEMSASLFFGFFFFLIRETRKPKYFLILNVNVGGSIVIPNFSKPRYNIWLQEKQPRSHSVKEKY